MTDIKDRERTRNKVDETAAEARRWRTVHAEALSKLAPGTTVIIDIATGEYVAALAWQDAEADFERRFGRSERPSFTFDVDRPLFIGGGLWQK
jgi:hypothetical protein